MLTPGSVPFNKGIGAEDLLRSHIREPHFYKLENTGNTQREEFWFFKELKIIEDTNCAMLDSL